MAGKGDLLEIIWRNCIRAAASRTFCTAGSNRPMRMAMTAITTSNSIRVKPGGRIDVSFKKFPEGRHATANQVVVVERAVAVGAAVEMNEMYRGARAYATKNSLNWGEARRPDPDSRKGVESWLRGAPHGALGGRRDRRRERRPEMRACVVVGDGARRDGPACGGASR